MVVCLAWWCVWHGVVVQREKNWALSMGLWELLLWEIGHRELFLLKVRPRSGHGYSLCMRLLVKRLSINNGVRLHILLTFTLSSDLNREQDGWRSHDTLMTGAASGEIDVINDSQWTSYCFSMNTCISIAGSTPQCIAGVWNKDCLLLSPNRIHGKVKAIKKHNAFEDRETSTESRQMTRSHWMYSHL
jgi:hypothetical protein